MSGRSALAEASTISWLFARSSATGFSTSIGSPATTTASTPETPERSGAQAAPKRSATARPISSRGSTTTARSAREELCRTRACSEPIEPVPTTAIDGRAISGTHHSTDRLDDRVELVVGEVLVHGEGQAPAGHRLGDRVVLDDDAVVVAVAVVVENRARVVDARTDARLGEVGDHAVAVDGVVQEHRVLVPHVGAARQLARRCDPGDVPEARGEPRGVLLPRLDDLVDPADLRDPHGGLEVGHPVVVTGHLV